MCESNPNVLIAVLSTQLVKLKLDDSSNTSVETTELHDEWINGRMKSAVLAILPLKIES